MERVIKADAEGQRSALLGTLELLKSQLEAIGRLPYTAVVEGHQKKLLGWVLVVEFKVRALDRGRGGGEFRSGLVGG